jgi:hypothetical protein
VRHPLKRALTPATNPAGLGSSLAAVYAAAVMIWNASHHHAVIDPQVIIAAVGAAAFLYARFKVTPVADPKDGNGQPLVAKLPTFATGGWVPPSSAPPEKTLITPPAAEPPT